MVDRNTVINADSEKTASRAHWGMPGPGGSMGRCAICGENFMVGVLRSLSGMESNITEFKVGFVNGSLYGHAPDCLKRMDLAFKDQTDPRKVRDLLPEGPLKSALAEAIEDHPEPWIGEDGHESPVRTSESND